MKYYKQKIKKLIRFIKRTKLKKELSIPIEAIHEKGVLSGYTCPRCGMKHCIYDFCLACGQRLSYDYSTKSKHIKRYKDVDEMVEKLSNIPLNSYDIKMIEQYELLTGEKPETIKEKRARYKINQL